MDMKIHCLVVCSVLFSISSCTKRSEKISTMEKYRSVQYELLRPSEVKSIQEQRPIVYIPVGSLEWHGVHNPLGTDALKAHAICCEAALRFGGVVLPPLFLGILGDGRGWGPEGWDELNPLKMPTKLLWIIQDQQIRLRANLHQLCHG